MSLLKAIIRRDFMISAMAFVAYLWVRFVQATSWTTYRNLGKIRAHLESGRPIIGLFWHSRGLFISKVWRRKLGGFRRRPIYGIFSNHADGRLIGRIFRMSGIGNIITSKKSVKTARDVAFKTIRLLRAGTSIGFTPDGPLGPVYRFNTDSVFLFAKASGAPIVPFYVSANRARFLNTWDRYMLIKPFSHSVIEAGDMVFVPHGASKEQMEDIKRGLEKAMAEKSEALDREMKVSQPSYNKG
ncbi:MAG: DUF374 domain-containing protein [Rickettsiales bacterium]|jgi:lysophospholipid acyltransferase (LPLAT)-like uncharacterized protein|nr:DUF374 domain-containing protein [Rickettsiales bacterium]